MDEQALFAAALEHESESARREFLEKECSSAELRARIEHLVKLKAKAEGFLDEPAAELPKQLALAEAPYEEIGQSIGPYKLLEKIGEGGMGVVYMAAQKTPVKRQVALKIIKPGMDTKQVVARFEAERQALALMDHPNIAHVLDAGATQSQRPYFVMELVRGIPVTEYCQREDLDLHARLRLFIDIAHSVQHAHQKGIIHRDIKPSNVMVTLHDGDPVVKMIDFGVAKAMNQQLTERTLYTNYAQMIGTPLYMSPEQAELSGLDVDTRSDIYSLGVLLYELLTGTTPFEPGRLREVGYDEMRRIIREEDPPIPSTRVSTMGRASETVTDQRKTNAQRMSLQLRGELDWIVIKALDKKRGRRYQTAKEFADDVERYLDGEPVEACPPSVLYRMRKLLVKHRGLIAAAAALTLLLLVGVVVSTIFAIQAMQAESRAETAQATAESISDFLSNEVLGKASPYENPKRDLQLREVLDQASKRIAGHFDKQPLVEAEIRVTLGRTYRHLGEYETAAEHLQGAYELRRTELGENHPDTLEAAFELGVVQLYRGDDDKAGKSLERVLQLQRQTRGRRHADTLVTMGWLAYCWALQRDFEAAEPLFEQANAGFAQVLGRDHPDSLDCLDATARMYQYQGRFDEAEALQTELLDTRRRVLGEDHPQVADSVSALAAVKLLQRKTDAALALYDEAEGLRERLPSGQHPGTLDDTQRMATRLRARRRHEASERLYLDNFKAQREQYGIDDERTLLTMRCLASLYWSLGRYDDAELMGLQIVDSRRRLLGDEHEETLEALDHLAVLYTWQGRFEDALKLFREIVETNTRRHGPDDSRTIAAVERLASGLQLGKHFDAATELMQDQLARLTKRLGSDAPEALACKLRLASILKRQSKHAEAEALLRELWESKAFGEFHRQTLESGHQLSITLRRLGRLHEAADVCREVLDTRINALGRNQLETSFSFYELATICGLLGRYKARARFLVSFTRIRRKIGGPDHTETLRGFYELIDLAELHEQHGDDVSATELRERIEKLASELLMNEKVGAGDGKLALAEVKLRLKQVDEALGLFQAVVAARRQEFGEADENTITATQRLATAYRSAERYDDALPIYKNLVDLTSQAFGADDSRAIGAIMDLLGMFRRLKLADEADELVEALAAQVGKDNRRFLQARVVQGATHMQSLDFFGAQSVYREVWEAPDDVLEPDDELRAHAGGRLTEALRANGQAAQAEPLARQVLAMRRRVSGEDSPATTHMYRLVGRICLDLGEVEEGVKYYETAYRLRLERYGASDQKTLQVLEELLEYAGTANANEHFESAGRLYKSAMALSLEGRGETHAATLRISGKLARSYAQAGKYEEAYETYRRDLELCRATGIQEEALYSRLVQTAEVLIKLQRYNDAVALLEECLKATTEHAPDHPAVAACLGYRGEILITRAEYDAAEADLLRSYEIISSMTNRDPAQTRRSIERLVALYKATGQNELAGEWTLRLD